jgi:hypothetical protein
MADIIYRDRVHYFKKHREAANGKREIITHYFFYKPLILL